LPLLLFFLFLGPSFPFLPSSLVFVLCCPSFVWAHARRALGGAMGSGRPSPGRRSEEGQPRKDDHAAPRIRAPGLSTRFIPLIKTSIIQTMLAVNRNMLISEVRPDSRLVTGRRLVTYGLKYCIKNNRIFIQNWIESWFKGIGFKEALSSRHIRKTTPSMLWAYGKR
jgi:hypothetical protein